MRKYGKPVALCAMLLCLLVPAARVEAARVTATVGNVKMVPGDAEVVVPLKLSDLSGVAGISGTLSYDPLLLEVTKVERTSLTNRFTLVPNLQVPGQVRFSMLDLSLNNGTHVAGTIVEMTFRTSFSATPGEVSELILVKFALCDGEGNSIPVEVRNGKVRVVGR